MGKLHMQTPIWVWCCLTTEEKHRSGRDNVPPLSVWPHAHTYAFTSEEAALAHPESVHWGKVHGFTLQKVYLQTEPFP